MSQNKTTKLVLFIEDNVASAQVLQSYLENATAFNVVHFTSSTRALAFIKKFPHLVTCIFSDIMMKELDGFQVLAEVRAHAPCAQIPFYFVSAVDPIVFQDILQKGQFTGFISKPVNGQALYNTLLQTFPDFFSSTRLKAMNAA